MHFQITMHANLNMISMLFSQILIINQDIILNGSSDRSKAKWALFFLQVLKGHLILREGYLLSLGSFPIHDQVVLTCTAHRGAVKSHSVFLILACSF